MYWTNDHMSGAGWVVMSIGMVAFWALVITAVVHIFRATSSSKLPSFPVDLRTPVQLLGERLARGEIDESEYASRLALLNS